MTGLAWHLFSLQPGVTQLGARLLLLYVLRETCWEQLLG